MILYEINSQLEELLEKATDPETGELLPEYEKQLDALNIDKEEKLFGYALVIKNKKAEEKAIKDEVKRLQSKLHSNQNTQNFLKSVLKQELHGDKMKDHRVSVYYQNSESVVTDVEAEAYYLSDEPNDFLEFIDCKESYAWKKSDIKESLKAGNVIPFAHLENKNSLVVR